MTSADIVHFLDIADFSRTEIDEMLELARSGTGQPLLGKGVALIFEKPSNRTRHSMEMAVVQLGGHPVYTRGEEIGLDARESVEDATRILSGYHHVIAARVFAHSTVERMAACAGVPVVNMLSDRSHPLQAMADALTMTEKIGPIGDIEVAWIGDYNNVARSLGEVVSLFGGSIRYGTPAGYSPSAQELERLQSLGGTVRHSHDPRAAVHGADVVHTDTWVSMGQETESTNRQSVFESYRVDDELMSEASRGAKFMHCMPAHRGEEVTASVFDGSGSLVIAQGHNRLHSARGVLAYLTGGNS